MSLFYFIQNARETPLGTYLFSYATESDLGFSKQDAALIDGIYYFCGLMGRLISAIVSIWLPVQITFGFNMTLTLMAAIGIAIWGRTSQLGFVICVWAQSFFESPLWPGCIAWTDQYIVITAIAYFMVQLGSNTSRLIFMPIYATYYDDGNPEATMYGVVLFSILQFALAVCRQIQGWRQGSRFDTLKTETVDDCDIEIIKVSTIDGNINMADEIS